MAKPLDVVKSAKIILSVIHIGQQKTADEFGVSKQYVHKVFKTQKSTALFDWEIFDEHGKERNFKELRKIFNNWQRV